MKGTACASMISQNSVGCCARRQNFPAFPVDFSADNLRSDERDKQHRNQESFHANLPHHNVWKRRAGVEPATFGLSDALASAAEQAAALSN
jgi:hypothetical protein